MLGLGYGDALYAGGCSSSCCIGAIISILALISVSLRILGSKLSVFVAIGDVFPLSDPSGCTYASVLFCANKPAG